MTPKEGLDSLDLQLSFQREAVRLVHGIYRLFPANKKPNGPMELNSRAVPKVASKPSGGKPRCHNLRHRVTS